MGNKHTHHPINEIRFNDINSEPDTLLSPLPTISENESIPTLLDAIKPCEHLVTDLRKKSEEALSKCKNPKDGLSCDQSAAVFLYTMEWPRREDSFYSLFNRTLRHVDSTKCKPYQSYHTLFMSALKKLPSLVRQVWRWIPGDLSSQYCTGATIIWSGVSSCSDLAHVAHIIRNPNEKITLFHIQCYDGKIIQNHSMFPDDFEILLPTGIQFEVISTILLAGTIYLVDMKQIPLHSTLIEETTPVVSSTATGKQNVLFLIWYDPSMNKSVENKKIQNQLRNIFNNNFETFKNENECEEFIRQSTNYDLILIVNGQMTNELVLNIHDLEQIKSIYIDSMAEQANTKWSENYKKVRSVVRKSSDLLNEMVKEKEINALKMNQSISEANSLSCESSVGLYSVPDFLRGIEEQPLVSLKEALEPIYDITSDLEIYIRFAMDHSRPDEKNSANDLSVDESAAIFIYSMEFLIQEHCLYQMLNVDLRSDDRNELEKWFRYLKLFLSGLNKLPSFKGIIWRCIDMDVAGDYHAGTRGIWWEVSYTTKKICALNFFLQRRKPVTIFSIECLNGKDIENYSAFPCEEQVVLMPGFHYEVINVSNFRDDLRIVQLKELSSPHA